MSILKADNDAGLARWRSVSPWDRERMELGLRTLLVGGGAAARTVARDLRRSPDYGLRLIGCLDDDPHLRSISGIPLLGTLTDLNRIVRERSVEAVVIAIPSLPPGSLSDLVRQATNTGVHVRYLPSFLSALERAARAADMRIVDFNRLLGRREHRGSPWAARAAFYEERVLVTGAGGSIGQELCRQVRSCGPASLHMLDHDESNLHTLQLELDGEALLDSPDVIIADIRDSDRISQIFDAIRPTIVLHAAAHKHLPLLERHPCEGVKSNVQGTQNLVEAALEVGVTRFVLISTDKAADPRSILGATKRLAEMVLQAHATRSTRMCSVRFGNVLGSRGSFLTAIADQLEKGGVVTVTHPDVTRFFMTVEEAVGLVLSATSMAEFGETFVLDMGQPVRIVDLVNRYAEQLHVPEVQIRYTGLRPGEKLHETLFGDEEHQLPTVDGAIWATRPVRLPEDFPGSLEKLYLAAAKGEDEVVRTHLQDLMPEYSPAPTSGKELLSALSTPYPDEF